ncbi:MAG: hypothetical protein QOF63_523, partial [Thermoanaerobaculia bacterium]|nr:hypothetical protein [Thermoanaerobaculia bacterium]
LLLKGKFEEEIRFYVNDHAATFC